MGIDHHVGFTRNGRIDHIADGQRTGALVFALSERGQRIRGLARLRNRQDQAVRIERCGAIAEFTAVIDLGRQSGQFLQKKLAHQPGVPGRTARHQGHALDRIERGQLVRDFAQRNLAGFLKDTAAHGIDNSLGLFMDFLQQEMLIAALLGRNRVPGNMAWFALNRPAGEVRDCDALTTHLSHFAVIQKEHAAGIIEQGGNIGGHKALLLPESDDNGRGVFGRQKRCRVALAQGNQGE